MDDAGTDPQCWSDASLFEGAACGLFLTGRDGTIRRANQTFCRWIGRDVVDLIGQVRMSDLLTMGGRIFHQTHWMPLLQMQGSISEVKLDVVHKDGRSIPMVINAKTCQGDDMTWYEYAAFVAEDRHKYEVELLQARRRAEDLLAKEQAAQQALSEAQGELEAQRHLAEERARFAEQMMAIVSHDLRNPLSVIRMSAHVIGLGDLSSNQLRSLERVVTATARANRLIADLLVFSKARFDGELSVVRKPLDLHQMIGESLEELRAAFPQRRLIHQATGTGACNASSDRLAQLLGNLVANAVTYGTPDKPVLVRTELAESTFSISVSNEGQEIAPEALPHLFDAMTRGDTGDQAHSVGLGLFIVREIARAHDGTVAVESGGGRTTFTATMRRNADNISPL